MVPSPHRTGDRGRELPGRSARARSAHAKALGKRQRVTSGAQCRANKSRAATLGHHAPPSNPCNALVSIITSRPGMRDGSPLNGQQCPHTAYRAMLARRTAHRLRSPRALVITTSPDLRPQRIGQRHGVSRNAPETQRKLGHGRHHPIDPPLAWRMYVALQHCPLVLRPEFPPPRLRKSKKESLLGRQSASNLARLFRNGALEGGIRDLDASDISNVLAQRLLPVCAPYQ